MARIEGQKWITANYNEYCGTIEEAVRRKEELEAKGYLILGEESGVSAPGPWICIHTMKPGTWVNRNKVEEDKDPYKDTAETIRRMNRLRSRI